jgi:hypothetical protein
LGSITVITVITSITRGADLHLQVEVDESWIDAMEQKEAKEKEALGEDESVQ